MKPLTKATRGVIRDSVSKGALVLAVAGALYFGTTTVVPIRPLPNKATFGTTGGYQVINKRIEEEDNEIFAIIQTFLQCRK